NKGSVAVEQGVWYDVRFELSGNTLRLYVDGELIKEAVDTSISSGKFGIRNGEAHSRVDDFVVYKLDAPYTPPSGEFSATIGTDKDTYNKGDLARITVKVKGENVDVSQTKIDVEVDDSLSSMITKFDIPMTRGVCVASDTEVSYCTWEGYWDTSLARDYNGPGVFIVRLDAELDDNTKSDSKTIQVRSDVVEDESLVDVSITPTHQTALPGESVTYKVTVKDNHPMYSSQAIFTYNLVVSGLPFKDTLPNKVTLSAGEEKIYEMTVYTEKPLEDAVAVEIAEIQEEIEIVEIQEEIYTCKNSDGGKAYYKKGTTTYPISGGAFETVEEFCRENSVQEYFCQENRMELEIYPCPYGCEDGACLREHEDDIARESSVSISAGGGAGAVKIKLQPVEEQKKIQIITAEKAMVKSKYGEADSNSGAGSPALIQERVSAFIKPVTSNNYYGKTYSFTVKANLQGQSNVRDAASASLFVGKKYIDEPEDPPEFPSDEYIIELEKGWNLVSVPGQFIKFDSEGCTNNRKMLGFVWLKDEQKYVTLKEAERVLGKSFKDYLSKNAFWIYSFEDCKLSISVRKETSYEDIDLANGWNLVPVTKDMVGNSLSTIGDCDYEKLYFWDANDQEWSSFSANYVFYSTDLTNGFIAKVDGRCTLGTAILMPPEMPED
ncbi:MAG: hypothetical protein ABIE94_05285, partial [archaeon]